MAEPIRQVVERGGINVHRLGGPAIPGNPNYDTDTEGNLRTINYERVQACAGELIRIMRSDAGSPELTEAGFCVQYLRLNGDQPAGLYTVVTQPSHPSVRADVRPIVQHEDRFGRSRYFIDTTRGPERVPLEEAVAGLDDLRRLAIIKIAIEAARATEQIRGMDLGDEPAVNLAPQRSFLGRLLRRA